MTAAGIAPPVVVTYGEIHFAKKFPVARTTCGQSRVPASADWAVVTCPNCLAVGSTLCQAARDRVAELARRVAEREREYAA